MGVAEALRVKIESLNKQINNVIEFVTQPKGVFETVDQVIKTARQSNQEALRALAGASMQVLGGRGRVPTLEELRRRIRRLVRV